MVPWQLVGDESLGMDVIENRDSPWHGIKAVPRMIQNQLGHRLELNMIDLDRKILKEIQSLVARKDPSMWVVKFLVFFFVLHVREIDAGRNIFWSRYVDTVSRPFRMDNEMFF